MPGRHFAGPRRTLVHIKIFNTVHLARERNLPLALALKAVGIVKERYLPTRNAFRFQ